LALPTKSTTRTLRGLYGKHADIKVAASVATSLQHRYETSDMQQQVSKAAGDNIEL